MKQLNTFTIGSLATLLAAAIPGVVLQPACAQVVPPPGYIYAPLELAATTQNCVASTRAGTFVGIGTGFTANGQSIVLANESGDLRLVAYGFSSLADCAYDESTDTLYVTDNADNADLGITTAFGNTAAQSGDTVFAIPAAATASGLSSSDLELLPSDSIEFAANLAVDSSGTVYVSDANGAGSGSLIAITTPGPSTSTFLSGFDFTAGLAIDPNSGDLFVGETLATFDSQIRRFDSTGTPVPPDPFAGPSFSFGGFDLAFTPDGDLLGTGVFAGDVVLFATADGSTSPFVSGLNFATGVSVHPDTGRVEILSSTFTGAAEDRSIHRFIRVDTLTPGSGSSKHECLHEFYGVELSPDSKSNSICTDGAACDADGQVNDECRFRLGSCFNVSDNRFPDCAIGDTITAIKNKTKPFSSSTARALRQAQDTLPSATTNCFLADDFIVPVKISGKGVRKTGKGKLKIKVTTDTGRVDSDKVNLICQPAP